MYSKWQSLVWAAAALALLLALNAMFTPGFFSIEMRDGHLYGSLIDVLNRAAPVGLLALGMTLVIATGGVDLSVGSVMAVAGAVAALSVNAGHSPWVAMLLALGSGLIAGITNGMMVAYLKIQPIVATLILMVSGRGIAQLLTDGQPETFDNPILVFLGGGFFLTLPFTVTLVIISSAVLILLLRGTALGLFIEATGNSPKAARLSGLPVSTLQISAYAASGFFAALAGMVVAADIKAADSNTAGLYLELDAILAVVIGGTALTGGRFSIIGSLIGALLMQALTTTILARGIQVEWNLVVKAAVILLVCLMQSHAARTRIAMLWKRRPA